MTALFQPFKLKDLTLRNRIAIPPMCQYSATDGVVNDWHRVHYPALARGGAGLLIVEATAVSPEGRITPGCLGLWNDTQAAALAPIAASIKAAGAVPGIQIATPVARPAQTGRGRATTTSPPTMRAAGRPCRPRPRPSAPTCPSCRAR